MIKYIYSQKKFDWRFPNEHGLSERSLDCKQLGVMEVLKWQQYEHIIPVFLNSFDCIADGLTLRSNEPVLRMGWEVSSHSIKSNEIDKAINSTVSREGYCLIYFDAYHMPLSSYFQTHNVVHWALVAGTDQQHVFMVDYAGSPTFFKGQIGKIPWSEFISFWGHTEGGIGWIRQFSTSKKWDDEFDDLMVQSVQNMLHCGGLNHLREFVELVEGVSFQHISSKLENLEFDIHNYRKSRELWRLAAVRKKIPVRYITPDFIEDLMDLCKLWSLVMGVLLKWKRQPQHDYRSKLTNYLQDVYEMEFRFFRKIEQLLAER